MSQKTKALCEGAIMVALALILGMLRLYRLPDGGSITLSILPLVFFAVRPGPAGGVSGHRCARRLAVPGLRPAHSIPAVQEL